MQNPDPDKPSIEIVDVGTTFHDGSLTVKYNPVTGAIQVETGHLKEKAIKMTLETDSDSPTVYTITRRKGGVYEANSWFTWVKRRKK